ncbi:MAG: cation:proton antiporter [Methanobacteriaceae archaeon]|nr:cation:proton antiporter [Methanobacteriaceae archaeon]MDZ4172705.1 cation:proton antiporter [Methanobacteriaceae archaeon]
MLETIIILKSILLIISSILVLLTAIGILRLSDDLDRVLYARIHILGVVDVACIIALLVLYEPLLAVTYFILAPFASHAIANAHYYGEEKR